MRFDYKEASEMSAYRVIQEGEASYRVLEAEECVSKSGNDMMRILHRLRGDSGEVTLYNQYIVSNEYAADNFFKIFASAGQDDFYNQCKGMVGPHDLLGLEGRCRVKTERSDQYGDKSKIGSFITPSKLTVTSKVSGAVCASDITPLAKGTLISKGNGTVRATVNAKDVPLSPTYPEDDSLPF